MKDVFNTVIKVKKSRISVNLKDIVEEEVVKELAEMIFSTFLPLFEQSKVLANRLITLYSLFCCPGGVVNRELQN